MTGENGPYYAKQREKCLEKVSLALLPDAAFEIVYYNKCVLPLSNRPDRNAEPEPISTSILRANYSDDDITEWEKKASLLLGVSFQLGDALLRKDGTYEPMRAQWEKTNPGFSSETYARVVSRGCFEAR